MNKTALWVWSAGVSLATGAISLYLNVKHRALNMLKRQGAFDMAVEEAESNFEDIQKKRPSTPQENDDVAEQAFERRRKDIIHAKGADTFAGSWKILPSEDRTQSIIFASIISVIAGAFTNVLLRIRPKGSRGNSGSSNEDGYWYIWPADSGSGPYSDSGHHGWYDWSSGHHGGHGGFDGGSGHGHH